MITKSPSDRTFPRSSGASRAVFTAIAATAALAVSVPSLWADTAGQTELNALLAPKNVVTATSKNLAAAVASSITSPSNVLTAADLAESALQPVGGKTRTDLSTSAPLVTTQAIGALLLGGTSTLAANVSAVVDGVIQQVKTDVPKVTTQATDVGDVIKAALGTVSDAVVANPSIAAENLDLAIGTAIAADAPLTSLQVGIEGINGAKNKSQIAAPTAAAEFVQGIISSGFPTGTTASTFAVAILKNVSANTSVDELVANQIGLKDTVGDLSTVASSLFAKYSAAEAKITQGLAAAIPAGSGIGAGAESARVSFVQSLVTANVKVATSALEGGVFVDPFYVKDFTTGVFTTVLNSGAKGKTTLAADATTAAKGVGSILGQDGDALTELADVYGTFIGAGNLPVTKAATYATTMIKAATVGLPASNFTFATHGGDGGTLNVLNISSQTAGDLASILDVLSNGVLTADSATLTGSGLTKAASQIQALAEDVAKFTKNELFNDSSLGTSIPVAQYLAGTLGQDIAGLSLGATAQTALFNAIIKGVTAVTNTAIDAEVKGLFNASTPMTPGSSYTDYTAVGAINTEETTITNL